MADATDPKVPDPQSLVDAALGTAPATPPAPPVAPAPAFEPAVKVEVVPEPEPPTVAVRDDTPLAFMTPPSSAPVTSTEPPVVPPTPEQPAYMSPVPPVAPAPVPEKKRGNGGKVVAAIVGFALLVGGVVGGALYYQRYYGEGATIAAITEEAKCSGCSKDVDGGWLVWRNGQCKVTGVCNSSKPKQDTQNPDPSVPPKEKTAPVSCNLDNGSTCCGADYTFCGGNIKKCVSTAELTRVGGGCNKYGEVVYGIPTIYGANYSTSKDSTYFFGCDCDGNGDDDTYFDKSGYCNQATLPDGVVGQNYNKVGLCAVSGKYTCDNPDPVNGCVGKDAKYESKESKKEYSYSCTDNNCTTTDQNCVTLRYTCSGASATNSCTNKSANYIEGSMTTPVQGTTGFAGKCGTVEQLDVACNGQYITSRTRINPPCQDKPKDTPTPSPSASVAPPTLACIGLTKDKPDTEIVIGSNLQFTCSGASAPIGAVSPLTYNFRLRIDSGAWQSLSATGDKANYTVAAEGDYDVECRVCGTIGSANVCSPTWTGVTP